MNKWNIISEKKKQLKIKSNSPLSIPQNKKQLTLNFPHSSCHPLLYTDTCCVRSSSNTQGGPLWCQRALVTLRYLASPWPAVGYADSVSAGPGNASGLCLYQFLLSCSFVLFLLCLMLIWIMLYNHYHFSFFFFFPFGNYCFKGEHPKLIGTKK